MSDVERTNLIIYLDRAIFVVSSNFWVVRVVSCMCNLFLFLLEGLASSNPVASPTWEDWYTHCRYPFFQNYSRARYKSRCPPYDP